MAPPSMGPKYGKSKLSAPRTSNLPEIYEAIPERAVGGTGGSLYMGSIFGKRIFWAGFHAVGAISSIVHDRRGRDVAIFPTRVK